MLASDNESSVSVVSSSGLVHFSQPRHSINQLALNMGFGPGLRPASPPLPAAAMTPPVIIGSDSQYKVELDDEMVIIGDNQYEEEYVINKVDPDEMTTRRTVVVGPKDSVRKSAMLLAGPKFRVNAVKSRKNKLAKQDGTSFPVAIVVGVISLIITWWRPISSYLSGFLVGFLIAAVIVYVGIEMYLNQKVEKTVIEEWIDFPALESMLDKSDKEDKNTNLHVSGAHVTFQRYDADRDDDFVRYPCDILLDGYRLIIHLATKGWSEEKKNEKDIKFVGSREYLLNEAKLMLVPEATLTRGKYWINDYPIVIQDLQIFDKQIDSKYEMDKSKLDINEFFTNSSLILSIWFETGPQKEDWFHKLSLILRTGKQEKEQMSSSVIDSGIPCSPSTNTSSLNHRKSLDERDIELSPGPINEAEMIAAIDETQLNVDKLQEKTKNKDSADDEKDSTGTHRSAARKSQKTASNKASLQKVLSSPECLDEAAITMNFLARRLLCDMFDTPFLKDALQEKLQAKFREIAVSIFDDTRCESVDMGKTFPVILKVEPMQWNTNGIWFKFFLWYRGTLNFTVKTRVALQTLVNFDPKKDKPLYAQHRPAQLVHKDDERIDVDDLIGRQQLLAKEPEMPEMALGRKFGNFLTNLATNKYFQWFANLPFVTKMFEKFSQERSGFTLEVTSASGLLTINIPPPPSDRIWWGFSEMPDFQLKVTLIHGEKQYSHPLIQDFLEAKVRDGFKHVLALPDMDDFILPLFRDWAIDIIGEIAAKPVDPLTDNYKEKFNLQASIRERLREYKDDRVLEKQGLTTASSSSDTDSRV